ncbi:hypothetical protein ABK040_013153 [Willaertia magna]
MHFSINSTMQQSFTFGATIGTAHKETIGPNVVLECGLKKENGNVSIVNCRVFVTLRSNLTNPTTKFENIIDVSNAIEKLKDKSGQVPPVLILYSDNHYLEQPLEQQKEGYQLFFSFPFYLQY